MIHSSWRTQMLLAPHGVGLAQPADEFVVDIRGVRHSNSVDMRVGSQGLNLLETRGLDPAGQPEIHIEPVVPGAGHRRTEHAP